ncbi:MAG: 3-keto-disaccharide hydrolase [Phycisphaerae bacterium]
MIAATAVMILFAGENLDNWIMLSGRWEVREDAMTCVAAPSMIRSGYESDEFVLRFQYRRASRGENHLAIHSKLTTGGTLLRLTSSGVFPVAWPLAGGLTDADDAWIDAVVEVVRGQMRITSGAADGPDSACKAGEPIAVFMPADSGGFLRFEAGKPGLPIRNVRVEEPGFRNLFDSGTLAGWEIVRPGNPESPGWSNENGVVRCRGRGSGWFRTLETHDNFILRLEYQLPASGNSGIYLRAPLEGRVSRIGLEVQLLDDAAFRGRFKPAQFAGSVYDAIAPAIQVPAPANQWNAIEVLLDGRRVRTILNGTRLYDARLDDASKDANSGKRPLSTRRLSGFIGLQEHSTAVQYRHVRLKELAGQLNRNSLSN